MDLSIRPARADDAQMLTAIAREAKAHGKNALALREVHADEIIRHTVLVAEVADALAGFAMLVDDPPRWKLTHLWIRPSQQRSGVGRALVTALTKVVASRRPGMLHIEAEPGSLDFYLRIGARQIGTVTAAVDGSSQELPCSSSSSAGCEDSLAAQLADGRLPLSLQVR